MMAGPRLYSPFDRTMWDSIAEGRMRIQCCDECGTYRYPPGACCPNCLSTESRWQEISGKGRVLSWITYHKQYLPAYPAPTTVVATMLDEGEILIAPMDHAETKDLALDRPVRVIYGDHPDGYKIPRVTLADG
jgi:uncharacterized OB-fold protein